MAEYKEAVKESINQAIIEIQEEMEGLRSALAALDSEEVALERLLRPTQRKPRSPENAPPEASAGSKSFRQSRAILESRPLSWLAMLTLSPVLCIRSSRSW